MKYFFLLLVGLTSVLIFGCKHHDEAQCKLTREDSLKVYNEINKNGEVSKGKESNILVRANFEPHESRQIDSTKAQSYLDNYLTTCMENGEDPAEVLRAFKIDRKAFGSILKDTRCVAIRMYLGKVTPGVSLVGDYTIMIVGVDSNGRNLKRNIWDESSPCPHDCPDDGDLAKQ